MLGGVEMRECVRQMWETCSDPFEVSSDFIFNTIAREVAWIRSTIDLAKMEGGGPSVHKRKRINFQSICYSSLPTAANMLVLSSTILAHLHLPHLPSYLHHCMNS